MAIRPNRRDYVVQVPLSRDQIDVIVAGLQMQICMIETGSPVLRAMDAQAAGKPFTAMTADQMRLVLDLEALVEHLRTKFG